MLPTASTNQPGWLLDVSLLVVWALFNEFWSLEKFVATKTRLPPEGDLRVNVPF